KIIKCQHCSRWVEIPADLATRPAVPERPVPPPAQLPAIPAAPSPETDEPILEEVDAAPPLTPRRPPGPTDAAIAPTARRLPGPPAAKEEEEEPVEKQRRKKKLRKKAG